MKHVSFGEKALLMGDDVADALLEYARLVGDNGGADTVTLTAIGPDGSTTEVGILLNSSTTLVIESTHSDVVPPDNSDVVRDLRERMQAITRPNSAQPEERWTDDDSESDYDSSDML
jgi:hypothetical protein